MIIAERVCCGTGVHKNKMILWCDLVCDFCDRQFSKKSSQISSDVHFCSRHCQSSAQVNGEVLDDLKRATFQQRYGVDNPSKSLGVITKRIMTNIERYGVRCTLQLIESRERTMMTRYGVKHALQNKELYAKAQESWMKIYGVDNPMKTAENREKARQYAGQKLSTHKFAPSKKECVIARLLQRIYGDVKQQAHVDKWWIDFYLPSIDTYVQYDGAFWHGLDERARQYESVQHRVEIDREQNDWFVHHSKRLIRITEYECDDLLKSESSEITLKTLIEHNMQRGDNNAT